MSSIKLEEGKFYRTRGGEKVGPMRKWYSIAAYPWEDSGQTRTWRDDGRHCGDGDCSEDIVAEWTDELSPPDDVYNDEAWREYDRSLPDNRPERVRILNDGAALTNGDRDDEYGPPANNMACAGELKATFRKWLARDISPGELEALDMAMTKLSRLACGKPKRDTYVDAATYIAIAGEVALKA